jgi:hypothetical protein
MLKIKKICSCSEKKILRGVKGLDSVRREVATMAPIFHTKLLLSRFVHWLLQARGRPGGPALFCTRASSAWLLRAALASFTAELHAGEEALKKRSVFAVEVEYSKAKHVQRSAVLR